MAPPPPRSGERNRVQHRPTSAGRIAVPFALRAKYPHAGCDWPWQWLFPATRTYVDRETRERRRHHLHETVLQRAVRAAAQRAGIPKPVSCPAGYDIRSLLGHRDVSTTMIYMHVLNRLVSPGAGRASYAPLAGIIRFDGPPVLALSRGHRLAGFLPLCRSAFILLHGVARPIPGILDTPAAVSVLR